MTEFWNESHLDLYDSINKDIWSTSPNTQLAIQPQGDLQAPGTIGAQQAMVGGNPLPWVPDIVGRHWQTSTTAIVVVGSAYAPFIREYSSRGATLSIYDYTSAQSAADFQRSFLKSVVARDSDYYLKIATMLQNSGLSDASNVVLTDLCKCSLAVRGDGRPRLDTLFSRPWTAEQKDSFKAYAENDQMSDWTWQRIANSSSNTIIALGLLAEHGLLRLFYKKLKPVKVIHSGTLAPLTLNTARNNWVNLYACSSCKVRAWGDNYWRISGGGREWRLYVREHPSSAQPTAIPCIY